ISIGQPTGYVNQEPIGRCEAQARPQGAEVIDLLVHCVRKTAYKAKAGTRSVGAVVVEVRFEAVDETADLVIVAELAANGGGGTFQVARLREKWRQRCNQTRWSGGIVGVVCSETCVQPPVKPRPVIGGGGRTGGPCGAAAKNQHKQCSHKNGIPHSAPPCR